MPAGAWAFSSPALRKNANFRPAARTAEAERGQRSVLQPRGWPSRACGMYGYAGELKKHAGRSVRVVTEAHSAH